MARAKSASRVTSTKGRACCLVIGVACLLALAGCQGGSTGSTDAVQLLITPVPSPTSTPLTQPTAQPVSYVVKSGDTLSGIADMFGVTVDDIVRVNNIADANSLQEGQILNIPGHASGTTTPAASSSATAGTQTPVAGQQTITPVLLPPTALPLDATPPQGPTVVEPGGAATSISSSGETPTVAP